MTKEEFSIRQTDFLKIIEKIKFDNQKVAIIGGHYMLLYESKSDSLMPMVYEDIDDWGNKTFAKSITQNFPVKSFSMSVELYNFFEEIKVDSKCVLLVDDDSFARRNFRNEAHYEKIKDRSLELRKKYFESPENIPESYKKILSQNSIDYEDFFAKFENKQFSEKSLLPRETIFISERKICRNFKKSVSSTDSLDSLFKVVTIKNSDLDNIQDLTVESQGVNSVCLIEKGMCNCGGKAFQFYYDLIKDGFDTIIFFVPEECQAQVAEGTNLICNSKKVKHKKINIINITNIEASPELPYEDKDIFISIFTNK